MVLVAMIEPSNNPYPGHMVIGEEVENEGPIHFGYRFDPADLPEWCTEDKWKDHLLNNKVPGYIVDETRYVKLLVTEKGRVYLVKRADSSIRLDAVMPPESERKPHASYSFNPDTFHSPESPCYNCVTWATKIGNQILPGFVEPVRQGRVKLMVAQLAGTVRKEGAGDR